MLQKRKREQLYIYFNPLPYTRFFFNYGYKVKKNLLIISFTIVIMFGVVYFLGYNASFFDFLSLLGAIKYKDLTENVREAYRSYTDYKVSEVIEAYKENEKIFKKNYEELKTAYESLKDWVIKSHENAYVLPKEVNYFIIGISMCFIVGIIVLYTFENKLKNTAIGKFFFNELNVDNYTKKINGVLEEISVLRKRAQSYQVEKLKSTFPRINEDAFSYPKIKFLGPRGLKSLQLILEKRVEMWLISTTLKYHIFYLKAQVAGVGKIFNSKLGVILSQLQYWDNNEAPWLKNVDNTQVAFETLMKKVEKLELDSCKLLDKFNMRMDVIDIKKPIVWDSYCDEIVISEKLEDNQIMYEANSSNNDNPIIDLNATMVL